MKILLINPPQTFFPGSCVFWIEFPLGIMYIASVLEKKHEVEILDTLTSVFRYKNGIKQYGMSLDKIKKEIKIRNPDIVGISNPSTAQLSNTINVLETVKGLNKDILTVVGGPHVSVRPEQFLMENKDADIVVIGEGEYTFTEIADNYNDLHKIKGIAFKRNDEVIINQKRDYIRDLDNLPFPAYHLVDMEFYFSNLAKQYGGNESLREITMITSRGCPYNCVFCTANLHMGKSWRFNSKEYVMGHIKHVIDNYEVNHIHFIDDNITLNKKRFEGILDCIIKSDLKFTWDTPTGIRADRSDKHIFQKMKIAGCTFVRIGVESGDQWVLDNIIDKKLRLEDVLETVKLCDELKIPTEAFFVIGFPGENKRNIQKTIEFALMLNQKYNTGIYLSIATPFYGTRLYDICNEKGYFAKELNQRSFSEAPQINGYGLIKTENFTPEDVKKIGLEFTKNIKYIF